MQKEQMARYRKREEQATVRDTGPYSTRNTSKGSLLDESYQILGALAKEHNLEEVRRQAQEGVVLHQSARLSRTTIWRRVHYRLLAHGVSWIIETLLAAQGLGRHSREFVSMVYLLYCLRDRLSFDFVTQEIWDRWNGGRAFVAPGDLFSLLEVAAEGQEQIRRWSESSRQKLSTGILSALRDFGLLEGVQRKRIVKPALPLLTAECILRLLTQEGLRGGEVIQDATWRLFLLSESEVAHVLLQLSQQKTIRFERAGDTTVLVTPEEWRLQS